jgi:hypothetical protein
MNLDKNIIVFTKKERISTEHDWWTVFIAFKRIYDNIYMNRENNVQKTKNENKLNKFSIK